MLFVAMGLVVVAVFRCEAGTTRPANGIGERGTCDCAREEHTIVFLCVVAEGCEGIQRAKKSWCRQREV